jgi:hypothetical protein
MDARQVQDWLEINARRTLKAKYAEFTDNELLKKLDDLSYKSLRSSKRSVMNECGAQIQEIRRELKYRQRENGAPDVE